MPKKDTKKHPSTAFNGERSQESRAPKTPGLTISKLDDARRNFLVQLHLPIQRIVVVVVGPVAFVLFGVFALLKDCWQGWVVFGGAVVMNLCWIGALQLFKKKLLNTSVYLFMGSVLSYTTVMGTLLDGLAPAAVLANLGAMSYGTLFSKNHMYLGAFGTVLFYVTYELAVFYKPFEMFAVSGGERLMMSLVLGIVIVPVIALFLRRSQTINDELFALKEKQNDAQAAVIETIHSIQPILSDAVTKIRDVSHQFVAQAHEQAAAATEINTTVTQVSMTAESTVQTAVDTQHIARQTREESLVSSTRLQEVEKGFNEVVGLIESARNEVEALASHVARIEEIIGFNLEIGQQIKILAVNAGIQSAKAGRHGAGFRVIASSLREMIHTTDENLSSSQKLLEEIRQRTKGSSEKIQTGAGRLTQYFKELHETGVLIERSADNLVRTTEQVTQIAQASREQRVGISGLSTAMSQVELAASDLSHSAGILLESIDKIVGSQQSLRVALQAEEASSTPEPADNLRVEKIL